MRPQARQRTTDPEWRPSDLDRGRSRVWVRFVAEPEILRLAYNRSKEEGISLSEVYRRALRKDFGLPE
jgi:hypothetical protein